MPTTRDVAVVTAKQTALPALLKGLLGAEVARIHPCDLAMGRVEERPWSAVVVENGPAGRPLPDPCAAVRWLMPRRGLVIANGDDPAGRRLAGCGGTFLWSDGDFRADLTASNINLRWGRLEFDALARGELARFRLPAETDVYTALSAVSCAVGLGMPLSEVSRRLEASANESR